MLTPVVVYVLPKDHKILGVPWAVKISASVRTQRVDIFNKHWTTLELLSFTHRYRDIHICR